MTQTQVDDEHSALHGDLAVHLESDRTSVLFRCSSASPDQDMFTRIERRSGEGELSFLERSLNEAIECSSYRLRLMTVDFGPLIDEMFAAAGERLGKVTSLRISPFEQAMVTPFEGWPAPVRSAVNGGWVHGPGGTDIHGRSHDSVTPEILDRVLELATQCDSDAICITAAGALVDPRIELRAGDYFMSKAPQFRVVMSHEAGGRRFVERENSTILNAALFKGTDEIMNVLQKVGRDTDVPVAVTAADGTRKLLEEARLSPVMMFGSELAVRALGAASFVGASSALVFLWSPREVRMLVVENGVLRSRHIRRSSRLGGVHISQRHAFQPVSDGNAANHVTPDLVEHFHVVIANGAPGHSESDGEFESFVALFQSALSGVHVVRRESDSLSTRGAAAALPLYELERFVVDDSSHGELAITQQTVRTRAQTAAHGPSSVEVLSDVVQPLSYLPGGPVLVRSVAVAREGDDTAVGGNAS